MAEWPCCHDPLRFSPASLRFVPPLPSSPPYYNTKSKIEAAKVYLVNFSLNSTSNNKGTFLPIRHAPGARQVCAGSTCLVHRQHVQCARSAREMCTFSTSSVHRQHKQRAKSARSARQVCADSTGSTCSVHRQQVKCAQAARELCTSST